MPKKKPVRNVIFEITDTDKPQTLHVHMVAATNMSFDVSFAKVDYLEVIQDVCEVAPAMMNYDSDLMEAFDDAFRPQPKRADKERIMQFMAKYMGVLSNVEIDFLEEWFETVKPIAYMVKGVGLIVHPDIYKKLQEHMSKSILDQERKLFMSAFGIEPPNTASTPTAGTRPPKVDFLSEDEYPFK